MSVLWLERAEADLDEIFDYLLEHDPNAALRVYEAVLEHTGMLAEYPGLGRPGRVVTTRELVIPQTPYIVAYTVDSGTNSVVILRVLHGARLWPNEI